MDWSKAKTVLIIALLITCLILSSVLVMRRVAENKADKEAAEAVVLYLDSQGASLNCDLPAKRPSLPVLFVGFWDSSSPEQPQNKTVKEYKGIAVETENLKPFFPVLISAGDKTAKIEAPAAAVLQAAAEAAEKNGLKNLNNIQINNVSLVYYIGGQDISANSEDTAIPSWKVETTLGTYFVNAFGQ